MSTHVVTKALPGPNGEIPVGVEVDASDWRNVDKLERQRYLRPLNTRPDEREKRMGRKRHESGQ